MRILGLEVAQYYQQLPQNKKGYCRCALGSERPCIPYSTTRTLANRLTNTNATKERAVKGSRIVIFEQTHQDNSSVFLLTCPYLLARNFFFRFRTCYALLVLIFRIRITILLSPLCTKYANPRSSGYASKISATSA
jgi:hypothetical protein